MMFIIEADEVYLAEETELAAAKKRTEEAKKEIRKAEEVIRKAKKTVGRIEKARRKRAKPERLVLVQPVALPQPAAFPLNKRTRVSISNPAPAWAGSTLADALQQEIEQATRGGNGTSPRQSALDGQGGSSGAAQNSESSFI